MSAHPYGHILQNWDLCTHTCCVGKFCLLGIFFQTLVLNSNNNFQSLKNILLISANFFPSEKHHFKLKMKIKKFTIFYYSCWNFLDVPRRVIKNKHSVLWHFTQQISDIKRDLNLNIPPQDEHFTKTNNCLRKTAKCNKILCLTFKAEQNLFTILFHNK